MPMLRRRSILPLLLTSFLGFPGVTLAAGTVSTCDEGSLDAALAGGGAVTFACDGTITLTATKTITADTSLDATGRSVTLSGNNSVRHFVVNSGVALSLTNLTIANGHNQGATGTAGMSGGQAVAGAILSAGSLTAVGCTFSGNTVNGGNGGSGTSGAPNGMPAGYAQGGAIAAGGGSVTLTNCVFTGNAATGGTGGNGVSSSGGTAGVGGPGGDATGGAIFDDGATLTITGTNAASNVAHGGAGGNGQNDTFGSTRNGGNGGAARGGFVSLASGSATLNGALVTSNSSTGGNGGASGMALSFTNGGATGGTSSGGAFDAPSGSVQISNVVLRANSATGGNGGANTIADFGGNGGPGSGGALLLTSGAGLVNDTVSSNNAAGGSGGQGALGFGAGGVGLGGGVFVPSASPVFLNSIFWGNSSGQVAVGGAGMPVLQYCDVQGGWAGAGSNNISTDPLFVSGTNLRIQPGSPCKDTGSNAAASGLTTDIASDPRIYNAVVDMGAYEYAPIALTSPPGQTVCPGTTVMFTVTVNSGQLPYAYQWRKNTSNLSDGGAISGSQTATLTITGATGANDGSYDVVVSDGSTATQLSVAATLTASDASGPTVTAPADATVTQTTCQ